MAPTAKRYSKGIAAFLTAGISLLALFGVVVPDAGRELVLGLSPVIGTILVIALRNE